MKREETAMAQPFENLSPPTILKLVVDHSFKQSGFSPVPNPFVGVDKYDITGLLMRRKPQQHSTVKRLVSSATSYFWDGNEKDELVPVGPVRNIQKKQHTTPNPQYSEKEIGTFLFTFKVNDSKEGDVGPEMDAFSASAQSTTGTEFPNVQLGNVKEKEIQYSDLEEWLHSASGTFDKKALKSVCSENSELFIIYDVLYSEKFQITNGSSSSATVASVAIPSVLKGSATHKGKVIISGEATRSGGEKPIAFRAGRVYARKEQGKIGGLRPARMDLFLGVRSRTSQETISSSQETEDNGAESSPGREQDNTVGLRLAQRYPFYKVRSRTSQHTISDENPTKNKVAKITPYPRRSGHHKIHRQKAMKTRSHSK